MKNFNKILKEAQKMQEKIQEEIAKLVVEASSGGGMVTVKMNGEKKVVSLNIDESIILKEEKEMLQDLIIAAINEASRKVDEEIESKIGGFTKGLNLPIF